MTHYERRVVRNCTPSLLIIRNTFQNPPLFNGPLPGIAVVMTDNRTEHWFRSHPLSSNWRRWVSIFLSLFANPLSSLISQKSGYQDGSEQKLTQIELTWHEHCNYSNKDRSKSGGSNFTSFNLASSLRLTIGTKFPWNWGWGWAEVERKKQSFLVLFELWKLKNKICPWIKISNAVLFTPLFNMVVVGG